MATKIYTVNGPEGPIKVEGPEGASDAEVVSQAKRLYAQQKAAPVTPSAAPVTQTASQPDTTAQGIQSKPYSYKDAIANAAAAHLPASSMPFINAILDKLPETVHEAIPLIRTAAATGSGMAAAGGASAFVGPEVAPVVGSATMAFMDQAIRHFTGEGTGGTSVLPDNPISAGIEGTVTNELGGRAMGVLGKGISEMVHPGSVDIPGMTDELRNLGPTYGQVSGHEIVENLLAKGPKTAAIAASGQAADSRMKEIVGELTQRDTSGGKVTQGLTGIVKPYTGPGPSNPRLSEIMQAEVKQGFRNSVAASNAEAQNFLGIAEQNQLAVPQPPQIVNTGVLDAMGNPITKSVPVPPKIISGPVSLDNTLNQAATIMHDMNRSAVPPDPENPLIRAIDGLFQATGTTIDKTTGQVLSHEPISAGDAWKTKQALDSLAYGDPVQGLNATDSKFKDLSKSLNSDIDNAIPQWKNSAPDAFNSWTDAKAIVAQRHDVFSPLGETGAGTKTLLNTVNAPDSAVDTILDDRRKLQRYLETGNLTVNGRQITSSNARRDMQGYAINRIWDKGFTPGINGGAVNGAKMATDWMEFAHSDQGKQLFSQQQVKNYTDLFSAIQKTSAPAQGSTRWVALNIGTRTLSLGTTVLASGGALAGGTLASGGVVGGVLGLAAAARVMASKKWAPVFLAMVHGRPLGMSFQAASRGVMQALSGGGITLQHENGDETEATIGTDGVVRPAKNASTPSQ